jgi:hypothetical protein
MSNLPPLTAISLTRHELPLVDVSWWVTPAAYAAGYYTKLYDALQHWLVAEFPFCKPYYSNAQLPEESVGDLRLPRRTDSTSRMALAAWRSRRYWPGATPNSRLNALANANSLP